MMKFEVGKYYRHSTGDEIYVVARVEGLIYWFSPALVVEKFGDGAPAFFGTDEDSAVNWIEVEPWLLRDGNVYTRPIKC